MSGSMVSIGATYALVHNFVAVMTGPSHAPRRSSGESSRIFVVAWRWYYRECLRACGHGSWTRES
jgi:hypothetical protein